MHSYENMFQMNLAARKHMTTAIARVMIHIGFLFSAFLKSRKVS